MTAGLSQQFDYLKTLPLFQQSRTIQALFNKIEARLALPLRPIEVGIVTGQPLIDPPSAQKIAEYTTEINGLITQIQTIASQLQPVDVATIVSNAQAAMGGGE